MKKRMRKGGVVLLMSVLKEGGLMVWSLPTATVQRHQAAAVAMSLRQTRLASAPSNGKRAAKWKSRNFPCSGFDKIDQLNFDQIDQPVLNRLLPRT